MGEQSVYFDRQSNSVPSCCDDMNRSSLRLSVMLSSPDVATTTRDSLTKCHLSKLNQIQDNFSVTNPKTSWRFGKEIME